MEIGVVAQDFAPVLKSFKNGSENYELVETLQPINLSTHQPRRQKAIRHKEMEIGGETQNLASVRWRGRWRLMEIGVVAQ
ncbi:MAG: hypothetical protein Q7J06_10305, partial [Bacteroidales bacterium]|nr:hypothetical protein [Bacteroidales bacterium]